MANAWDEYANGATEITPPPANPWEQYGGIPTPGPNLAGQIPLDVGHGAPVSPESWNPLTMTNAKQALADIIRGGLSTTTLLDRATNTMPSFVGPPNPNKPNLSTQVEPWLQKTFGQPDTSTAGRIGNFAATLAGGAIDPAMLAGRALGGLGSVAEAGGNAVRNGIFSDAQNIGMKLPPNYVHAGAGSRTASFLAGNDAMAAKAQALNSANYDTLSRQVAGLTPNANLTEDVLNNRATDVANKTYEPLKNLGIVYNGPQYIQDLQVAAKPYIEAENTIKGTGDPRIKALIDKYSTLNFNTQGITTILSNLREDANKAFKAGDVGLSNANRGVAQALENSMQANLQNPASPISKRLIGQGNNSAQMLNDYLDGRRQLAQIYAVRDALTGTGSVNPQAFADNMTPAWTGNLRTMGQFANAAPDLARFTTKPPKTFLGATKTEAGVIASPFMMAGTGNWGAVPTTAGLAAGAAARAVARNVMLQNWYQKAFVHPTTSIMQQPGVQNAVPAFIQNSGLFGQQ